MPLRPSSSLLRGFLPALALAATLGASASAAGDRLRIDPARTAIRFEVPSSLWGTTRGQFTRFDGRLVLDFRQPQRSSVAFDVEAASVTTGSKSVDDYIRSEVLFDVARFPSMRFVSRSVEKIDERSAWVTGELTLRGRTHPSRFLVAVERRKDGRALLSFVVRGQVKRTDFGMDAGVPVVSDEVTITVTTETAEP